MIKNVLQKLLHFNEVKNRFKIFLILSLFANKAEKTEYNKGKQEVDTWLKWFPFLRIAWLAITEDVRKGLLGSMVKKGFLNKQRKFEETRKCSFVDIFSELSELATSGNETLFHRRSFKRSTNSLIRFTIYGCMPQQRAFWFVYLSFNHQHFCLKRKCFSIK